MIPHATASFLSTITALGAPVANHVWQSTLFAVVAALLTLALRKNRAETRYWLWLAASLKFLLPFSLLVVLGSHLGWTKSAAVAQPSLSLTIQQVTAPFGTAPSAHRVVSSAGPFSTAHALPLVLASIWALGCAAILCTWMFRWLRLARTVRQGTRLTTGREIEILHRVASNTRSHCPRVVATPSTLEPGVVGIFRPVLLLPEGIADRLSDAQLESIFAHELCHVRRRDNLAAAAHMLVEAVFWFHPLVWWMGARLIDERERACDEAVLHLGGDPQSYAEGILKVCEFYLESPLVCAAGVTGSNLKKRIEAIMIQRINSKLNFGRKLLLSAAAAAALLIPITIGLLSPVSSRAQSQAAIAAAADTVSITPSTTSDGDNLVRIAVRLPKTPGEPAAQFSAKGVTLAQLIAHAYEVNEFQVSGGPAWVASAKYDVEAKSDGESVMPAVQAALTDRFKLAMHHETNIEPAYELVISNSGSKLKEVSPEEATARHNQMFFGPAGHLSATQVTIAQLAKALEIQVGRAVVDKTGLTGLYDFNLDWNAPWPNPGERPKMPYAPTPDSIASLMGALPQELGLELHEQNAPVDTIVIDYAEQPAVSQ